jgi:hypothetical protein
MGPKTLLCGHYVLLWPYGSELALSFTQTYLPHEIRFVLLLERSISLKLLEFLYVSLFVSRKYVDKDSFLCNISISVGAGSNLFLGVYYLSLVIVRIRHWKKFIMRNSPVQTASLVYTLSKAMGSS